MNHKRPRLLGVFAVVACPASLPPIRSNPYGPHAGEQKTDRRRAQRTSRQGRNGISSGLSGLVYQRNV
ncbi:hypothetical protein [Prochlorococcus sp. MIT 1307]|uniref:hypothetical protein n=1 Tax=Prochlorococcus sp. MIT 1307 TaxID=3096219 RepID=UPI002A7608D8|nr:hypothetical protein [Prochlorococcus sp. MIT 1307]